MLIKIDLTANISMSVFMKPKEKLRENLLFEKKVLAREDYHVIATTTANINS